MLLAAKLHMHGKYCTVRYLACIDASLDSASRRLDGWMYTVTRCLLYCTAYTNVPGTYLTLLWCTYSGVPH